MSPTISTKKAKETKRAVTSKKAMERETVILLAAGIAGAATITIHLVIQIALGVSDGRARARELIATRSERVLMVKEADETFAQELEIAMRAQGEDLAGQRRAEEFARRQAEDPDLAQSETEKAMLKMKRLGEDLETPADQVLEKIARLASPPKSGVGVFKLRNGYKIEVAIAYEKVTEAHPEVSNYSLGMYREVRRTAAGIIRDVFAYGGARGAVQVTVNCQNKVSVKDREGSSNLERRDMFVVTADQAGRDWSRMTRVETEKSWRKEKDQFPSMLKGIRP